jgi:DNA-binding NarL/FixJ family response regulator
MSKLHILLADDHAVVREGLRRLIELQPDMEVVAEAAVGNEAVAQATRLRPDVAVVDVSMGQAGGADATKRLRMLVPPIRVLALTVHEDSSYLRELLEAGASGYMLKRAAAEELIRAIRAVAAGGVYVDPRVGEKLVRSLGTRRVGSTTAISELSEREDAVLRLIAQGYTNKEIAAQLGVSVKTVETYKARSMEKLGLRSRVDIVRTATERGWAADRELSPPLAKKEKAGQRMPGLKSRASIRVALDQASSCGRVGSGQSMWKNFPRGLSVRS